MKICHTPYVPLDQTFECINSEIQFSSDDSLNPVSNAQGIVEICINGRWRRVCATGSPIEIELLCNLLGFQNTTGTCLTLLHVLCLFIVMMTSKLGCNDFICNIVYATCYNRNPVYPCLYIVNYSF